MSDDFEVQLRAALRRVDPDEDFARRVTTHVMHESRRSARMLARWSAAALAASVVITVLILHTWQLRREKQGLEARRQLIEALQVTGEKLDLAYQVINTPSRDGGSGA